MPSDLVLVNSIHHCWTVWALSTWVASLMVQLLLPFSALAASYRPPVRPDSVLPSVTRLPAPQGQARSPRLVSIALSRSTQNYMHHVVRVYYASLLLSLIHI